MSQTVSPTVSLRVLGNALRRYRKTSGHTLATAARAADYHPASLSKAESGKIAIHPGVVRSLLDFYGINDVDERDNLVRLARQGRKRGWWHEYKDLLTVAYLGMECVATRIHSLESQLVPGLLQVDGYFRALARAEAKNIGEDEVERRITARKRRQEILHRTESPCELWSVIDESVLYRPIGSPEIMAEQFDHLIQMTGTGHVNIQVIPFVAGEHGSLGARFTILKFDDAEELGTVFLEQLHWREEFVEEKQDVQRFCDAFDHARALAESPAKSRALLKSARDRFHKA